MKRLMEYTVFSGLRMACRLAICRTRRSPVLVNATTDGVRRLPSALGITCGSPPMTTEITELVVPKSIPTTLAMFTTPSHPVSTCVDSLSEINLDGLGLRLLAFGNADLQDAIPVGRLGLIALDAPGQRERPRERAVAELAAE